MGVILKLKLLDFIYFLDYLYNTLRNKSRDYIERTQLICLITEDR